MIYVYKMWDFHNGYWTFDSPEKREKIDDSDDWYWMDQHTYKQQVKSILICEGDNFLEMIVTEGISDNLIEPRDWEFKIRVQSSGFTGQARRWIDGFSLRSFVEDLQKLENQRQGKAEVSSMSYDQFWLKICSIDSVGHMALFGRLSRFESKLGCKHLLEFGFSFDPSVLPSIVKNFEAIVQ
ncbi:MAG: hypothetical protein V7K89_06165 [Nostoc sp.]|uniref:WapI family immunity protein n=1 Tax=Nostoc sp. TaxID=1180 RepID=UPI002FF96B95